MEWVWLSVGVVLVAAAFIFVTVGLIAAHNRIDDLRDRVKYLEGRVLLKGERRGGI